MLNMQSDTYLNLLILYLLYNRVVAKSEFEFKTQKEYDEYLKLNPPTTVNNEAVKSYGEMDIANFLMQNGIQYVYEYPYEIDTRTSEYGQYHPDFESGYHYRYFLVPVVCQLRDLSRFDDGRAGAYHVLYAVCGIKRHAPLETNEPEYLRGGVGFGGDSVSGLAEGDLPGNPSGYDQWLYPCLHAVYRRFRRDHIYDW